MRFSLVWSTAIPRVPYFNQWDAPEQAGDIISGKLRVSDLPHWRESGADTQQEFITWANHICGMCCLKMALAALTGDVVPLLTLTRQSLAYGTYVQDDTTIKGMIYAPFVDFVRHQYGLTAQVEVGVSAESIADILEKFRFFIASVHPSIRQPTTTPPKKGGHLVLAIAADNQQVIFHNPSGQQPDTQQYVRVSLHDFSRFFAGRGVALAPRSAY
jgi:hypothetical protein